MISRICPHLPSSGFRRDGPQSLPHRAGLTRAGKIAFPATGGGEKMETAIRVRAATVCAPRIGKTQSSPSSLVSNARSSFTFDYAGIDGEEIDKKPKTIR